MSSKGSASDSANVNVVRNPKVHAEPINLSVKGMFHFKIERAGGLVEEFTAPNLVTQHGLEQLLTGIATKSTTNNFASAANSYTSRKCGLFLSTTAVPGSGGGSTQGSASIDLDDSTGSGGTAYCGSAGSVTNTGPATNFSEVLDSSNNLLYMLGDGSAGGGEAECVFGTTAVQAGTGAKRKVVSAGVKVDATDASGTIKTAGICIGDVGSPTAAAAKVFCVATISDVALTNGDSLTTTYTIELT